MVNKAHRKGICPKLQRKWLGLVLVTQKLNDVTYRIRLSKVDTKVVPYEQLKPYRGDPVPTGQRHLGTTLFKLVLMKPRTLTHKKGLSCAMIKWF